MFAIASHQSSQPVAARTWSPAFALAVSYSAQPFHVFGDKLCLMLLAEGSRADLLRKLHASFRMRGHLSPCHPRPRGRRRSARSSKRWERDLVSMCHQTFASRAVLGSRRWAKRLYCGPIVVGLALPILAHKPDAKLQSSPSLLASAGAVRQLADAAVQAVQRPAEGSPVTAFLSSLTACRSCRR